jgi:membrane-associated phospholipid phosphatase
MKKTAYILLLLVSSNLLAKPRCLITNECIEYNGKIIDLRSNAAIALDKVRGCDPLVDSCLDTIPESSLPVLNEGEFKRIVGEKGPEYFIPIELRSSDMMTLAGALSLGVVVFANDREIMDYVQDHKTNTAGTITTIGNAMGREAIIPIAAGAYFIGAVMKNGKLKKVGMFAVAGGLASQIVTEAFKKSFQRVRPNGSDSPYDFFEDHNNSFFSGHTSGAFSLATVIAEVYKDKPIVPYVAYGVAALTAYARMHDQKHWASDVLAGAVAGHLITKILIRSLETSERTGSGLIIIPDIGRDSKGHTYTGVQVQWRPQAKSTLSCSSRGLSGGALIEACFEEAFAQSGR